MTNIVTEYLREHTVSSLEQFGIFAKYSNKNPRKFCLNYDQIEAINGHALVNACRGLVLLTPENNEDYQVVAWPFDRFYNYGSEFAAELNPDNIIYEHKLDGTCCIVYWDSILNEWCVGTRNVPDGDLANSDGKTFAEMFWDVAEPITFFNDNEIVIKVASLDYEMRLIPGHTYVFELCGPDNQIVIPYDEWSITLLAQRNNTSGVLTNGSARHHAFGSIEECIQWLSERPGNEIEGFVANDGVNRVKIKNPNYLTLSRVVTRAGSSLGLIEIVLSGQIDDVVTALPKPVYARLKNYEFLINRLIHTIEAIAKFIPKSLSRKEVALMIQGSEYSGWLDVIISIWSGKIQNVSEWIGCSKNVNVSNNAISKNLCKRFLDAIE